MKDDERRGVRRRWTAQTANDERDDRFATQFLVGVSADVVIAVTTFAMAIVTARAFGADDRGVYALGQAASALAGVLFDLGMPTAAMTLAARGEARIGCLHAAGLGYAVLMSGVVAGLLALTAGPLTAGPLQGFPTELLPLLGLAAGGSMYVRHVAALLTAQRKVRSASLGRTLAVLGLAVSAIVLLAGWGGTTEIAVLLVVVGQLVGAGLFLLLALRRGMTLAVPGTAVIRSLLSYGARSQIGSISRQGFLRVDYYVLNAIAGPRATGVYSIAVALAEGVWLLMGSIYRALVGRLGGPDARAAAAVTGRVFRTIVVVVAAVVPVVLLVAPLAIPLLFGAQYRGAVVPFLILAAGTVCYGLYNVLSGYVLIQERRPLVTSIVEASVLVLSLPLYVVAIRAADTEGAAAVSSLAYLSALAALVVYFRRDAVRRGARLLPRRADVHEARRAMRSLLRPT